MGSLCSDHFRFVLIYLTILEKPNIKPHEDLLFELPTPVQSRIITIRMRLPPTTEEKKRQFHIGRLQVLGEVPFPTGSTAHSSPLAALSPMKRTEYDAALNKKLFDYKLAQVKPLWNQYRSGKMVLDICVEPVYIVGFSLLVRHGDDGVASQVFFCNTYIYFRFEL
jgi:hypothetical protein